jgi:hypothetical protein
VVKIKIAVHQPNYLPYIGFFDKMKKSDIFVIYDDAQFNKSDFQHRNKIRIHQGWKWLTVPVEKKSIPIKDIKVKYGNIKKELEWNEEHLREIKDNYRNAPNYANYIKYFELLYEKEYENLIDINMEIIKLLKEKFEIDSKLIFSSELGLTSKATSRLVEITEILNGDIYLSGPAGRNYLDVSLFEEKGIKVEYQDLIHPIYKQQYQGFIPNMSSIDFLLNANNTVF